MRASIAVDNESARMPGTRAQCTTAHAVTCNRRCNWWCFSRKNKCSIESGNEDEKKKYTRPAATRCGKNGLWLREISNERAKKKNGKNSAGHILQCQWFQIQIRFKHLSFVFVCECARANVNARCLPSGYTCTMHILIQNFLLNEITPLRLAISFSMMVGFPLPCLILISRTRTVV